MAEFDDAQLGLALARLLQRIPGRPHIPDIKLKEFDESQEPFEIYLQRLDNYFNVHQIAGNTPESQITRTQILIGCIGTKTYQLLASLTAPALPSTKPYNELTTLLKSHLSPVPNEVLAQHKFLSRVQQEGESISTYMAELRRLTSHCNFTCSHCQNSFCEKLLRCQFIRGINDQVIRERLLQEANPTLDRVLEIALAIEASQVGNREILQVNKLQGNKSLQIPSTSQIKSNPPDKPIKCYRCGGKHLAKACTASGLHCDTCSKAGHLATVCKSKKKKPNPKRTYHLQGSGESNDSNESEEESTVHMIRSLYSKSSRSDSIMIPISIDGKSCKLELDTGSEVTTMNVKRFRKLFPHKEILPTSTKLKTYSGEILEVLGKTNVTISFKNKTVGGRLFIVNDPLDSVIGRDWIKKLGNIIEVANVKSLVPEKTEDQNGLVKRLCDEFQEVFKQEVGTIPNFKCHLTVKDGVEPIFMKPRQIPYAIKGLVEEEIRNLEKAGIFERVVDSAWGTPLVTVIKPDHSIRLCADYKVTVNKCLVKDRYPIPNIDELYSKLGGGKYFTVLDIHKAYLHMPMDEESAKLQTVSTHLGQFKVNKLMFGVSDAPSKWQSFMDQALQGLQDTVCFFDDIAIKGNTIGELYERTRAVLERLKKYNLHLTKAKCKFFQTSINYLGHTIDANGLHKNEEKTRAITAISRPKNVPELRKFLGMANYYNNFIPDLATKLHPLNRLLRKGVEFVWSKECERAFTQIKEDLSSDCVLIPFNSNLPLVLATDASPHGISAILSHRTPNGERPIAYASRTLSQAETNYSQLDREATAIFWALHKFYQYCYGREFILVTDNKPLQQILHPDKKLPALTAGRLLRYANFISAFNYKIEHRPTSAHANADLLSRSPLECTEEEADPELFSMYQLHEEVLPVTSAEIARETQKDEELSQLVTCLTTGKGLQETKFKNREPELMLHNGCVYLGDRVMIPGSLRKRVLDELHSGHMGIVKMKSLARSYCYWRNIDKDIENIAKSCYGCCQVQNEPPKAPVHPWELPSTPWQRVHLDFAGPFLGSYFLVLVDAKSKWLEVIPVKSISTKSTINCLRDIFTRFGMPSVLVNDCGTSLTSKEFREFLQQNGITHRVIAPAHPASNGQAERFIQTVKKKLRAALGDSGDLNLKLNRFLFNYRRAPHASTGESPASQILNFPYRSRLDLLKEVPAPSSGPREQPNVRTFKPGDKVQIRCYTDKNQKWMFGTVIRKMGLMHYLVNVNGKEHKRHIDQMRSTLCDGSHGSRSAAYSSAFTAGSSGTGSPLTSGAGPSTSPAPSSGGGGEETSRAEDNGSAPRNQPATPRGEQQQGLRRSKRIAERRARGQLPRGEDY